MWVRAAGTGVDIHDAELQTTECAGQFCSAINRDLIARYGVDANLAAEKQLILVAQGEGENAGVLQEKSRFSGRYILKGVILKGCRSTSVSAKSVLPVRFRSRLEPSPYFISTPAVSGERGAWPVCLSYLAKPYGLTMKSLPLPISCIPRSSPASDTFVRPNVRR